MPTSLKLPPTEHESRFPRNTLFEFRIPEAPPPVAMPQSRPDHPARPRATPATARVLGRLADLAARERCEDEERLCDVLTEWSTSVNHAWLLEGTRRGAPFLQISSIAPGSVLAWEIAQLEAEGYVKIGPLWVPVVWLRAPARARMLTELLARHLLEMPDRSEALYVPKAAAELGALLALWPHALALPTSQSLSLDDLVLARAWPIHPLGVTNAPRLGDGRTLCPAEFFYHDVDHARFKVREDLLARGITLPDAYENGTTLDAASGAHRTFLAQAVQHVDADGWRHAARRATFARTVLRACTEEPERALGEAARWLLFELVHEKSLPLEPATLARALATPNHEEKLRMKCVRGFFGEDGPSAAAVARLDAARAWLGGLLADLLTEHDS